MPVRRVGSAAAGLPAVSDAVPVLGAGTAAGGAGCVLGGAEGFSVLGGAAAGGGVVILLRPHPAAGNPEISISIHGRKCAKWKVEPRISLSIVADRLARISHQLAAAALDPGMSAALRSVECLDVLSSTPAAPSGRVPCIHARLRRLATKSGEKSGLDACPGLGGYFSLYAKISRAPTRSAGKPWGRSGNGIESMIALSADISREPLPEESSILASVTWPSLPI
jgi:hypothetical protein